MSALLVVLIIVLPLAAYLAVGAAVMKRSLPGIWKRELTLGNESSYTAERVRNAAACRVIFWPIMVPLEVIWQAADAANPKEIERRDQEQKRRIRELERELGL